MAPVAEDLYSCCRYFKITLLKCFCILCSENVVSVSIYFDDMMTHQVIQKKELDEIGLISECAKPFCASRHKKIECRRKLNASCVFLD